MKRTASLLLLLMPGCGSEAPAPARRGDPVAFARGERAFLQEDFEEAADAFSLAAQAGDREAGVWQARSLMKLGLWREAERAFRSGLALPGEVGFQAKLGLGETLLAQSRPEEAFKVLEGLDGDPAAVYRSAVAALRSGDFDDAGARLQRVRSEWPSTSWAALAEDRLSDVAERRFRVQLGVYAQAEAADRRILDLGALGIRAVRATVRRGGAELFSVRSGTYATYREAVDETVRLKGLGEDAVVVP